MPVSFAERQRRMVDVIEDYAILFLDGDGLLESCNKGMEMMTGFSPAEITGKHFRFLYPVADISQNLPEELLARAATDRKATSEGWRLRKDGSTFWAGVVLTALYDDAGKVTGYSAIISNASAARQAEDELEKKIQERTGELERRERKFRALLENNFDAIALSDASLKVTYRSPSSINLTGWTDEDREKTDSIPMTHPDDIGLFKETLQQVLANPGKTFELHFRTLHKAGHYVLLEGRMTNLLENEDVRAIVSNFRDVTERRKAEDSLTKTLEEISAYKYALDESSIVAITDQKGIIKHVNENFCKISKYTAEELIGQDHRIINSGYHGKEFIRELWVTIANGKIWRGELKNRAKDGTYYWVDTTIVPFLDAKGKPYQYAAIRADITQRKEAEESLRQSLKETSDYKYAIDESSIIAITDQKGIIKYANNNFCRISKYSADELIGQDHRILNSGHHSKEMIRNLWVTIANGRIWRGELKNRTKYGNYYWVDTTIIPFLDNKGKPYQYVAIRADITQRKEAEEKNIKLNRLYAFISQINQTIVHVKDEQELFSKACNIATSTGKFTAAWVGMIDEATGSLNLIAQNGLPSADLPKHYNIDYSSDALSMTPVAQAIQTGEYAYSNNIHAQPGPGNRQTAARVYNSFIALPIRLDEKTIGVYCLRSSEEGFFDYEEIRLLNEVTGDIAFSLGVLRQDQQRRRTELQLALSEKRLKEAETLSHLGHWELDLKTDVVNWSDESFRILGLEPGSIEPSLDAFLRYIHPEDAEMVGRIIGQSLKDFTPYEFYHRIISGRNTVHTLMVKGVYEFSASGEAVRLHGTLLDVSDLAEKELQLAHANKELETFIYKSSHDLRGPLSSMMGLINISRKEAREESIQRYLGAIGDLGSKLDGVLSKLIEVMAVKNREPKPEPVDMNVLVEEVISALRYMDGFDRIKMTIRNELTGPLNTDRDSLYSILLNLVDNAVKYNRNERTEPAIDIVLAPDATHNTLIMVSDNGVGITAEAQDKVFDMFYRASTASKGSGLGLYLVKTTVEKLGGSIVLESAPGEGSTFKVLVPAG